jgi:hypothetical protein
MPCSFFNEPIITSQGVIFGLETNGNYITGNLPVYIQAAYVRNNQVPYVPFTNVKQHSTSYVSEPEPMSAYDRITKYNLPAYVSAPVSKPDTPITREQELELETIIIKKTGLNHMLCTTYGEYTETVKQINKLVKLSIEKGLDNAISEYKDSKSSNFSNPKTLCISFFTL